MDLTLPTVAASLAAAFILGTLGLWMMSATANLPNAKFKVAAFYNIVMMAVGVIMVAVGILSLTSGSTVLERGFIVSCAITFTLGFIMLRELYDISFTLAFCFLAVTVAFQTLAVKTVGKLFVTL